MQPDQVRKEYWAALNEHLEAQDTGWSTYKPNAKNWMKIHAPTKFRRPKAHMAGTALIAEAEIRANFVLEDPASLPLFEELREERRELEREVGHSLTFARGKNNREVGRIYARRRADFRDQGDWSRQFEWLYEVLAKLYAAFHPRVA